MEIWKKLEGFDVDYEISNCGQIKNSKTNRILKLQKEIRDSDDYIRIRCNLIKNGKTTKPIVSRLVLLTFNPIQNSNEYQVDHIDFDPTNNNLQNLRWLKPEDNNKRTVQYYESKLAAKDKIIEELRLLIKSLK